jgi:hypothetical protein
MSICQLLQKGSYINGDTQLSTVKVTKFEIGVDKVRNAKFRTYSRISISLKNISL